MDAVLITGVILVLVVLIALIRGVRIVPQSRAGLVYRLGRYRRILQPGVNMVVPFVDRVRVIDLQPRSMTIAAFQAYSDDNRPVGVQGLVSHQVISPEHAVLDGGQLEGVAMEILRDLVARQPMDELIGSRAALNDAFRERLDRETRRWGVRVHHVDIVCQPA